MHNLNITKNESSLKFVVQWHNNGSMIKKEKIIDDVSRVASGAATMMTGLTKQIKTEVRTRVDEWGQKMDFVPREDFERLEAVVQDLAKKVDGSTGTKKKVATKTTTKKPVSKKTPAKKAATKTKAAAKAVKKKAIPKKTAPKKSSAKKTTAKKKTS